MSPSNITGEVIETDVLVVGAGAGGLLAALSAKRHGPPGTRVTLVDTSTVGRSGHTSFSNFYSIAALPEDDLDAITDEIIVGNDFVADQVLVREVLLNSFDRIRDLEGLGIVFDRDARGEYIRPHTRGLDAARLIHPTGGGLETCWRLRRALETEGVQILDRLFITGLMRSGTERITGAVGISGRTGEFRVLRSRTTIIATNAPTFRSGFVRDLTGTGTLLAYKAGATLRNAEFSYLRPGTPNYYFEGITLALQDGARFVNAHDERFMPKYDPVWADEADVPSISRAMCIEKQLGNDPLYLDMRPIPDETREAFMATNLLWMRLFYKKLSAETRMDMFGKVQYYPMNQMTKMGIRTDVTCRSEVPGLLAAGLAQAGCANHFAGFHIGISIGTGWFAGRSAVEDLESLPSTALDVAEVTTLHKSTYSPLADGADAESDRILRGIQSIMFRWDVSVWKHEDRLKEAREGIRLLKSEVGEMAAPHAHELVRLKETEAMVLAAELILESSLMRPESRLSHLREDHLDRDDRDWLCWIDVQEDSGRPNLTKNPIPTPICSPGQARNKPVHRAVSGLTKA